MGNSYPVRELPPKTVNLISQFNGQLAKGVWQTESVSCVICRSNNTKRLFSNDRYGIQQHTVLCNTCGLVFGSPRLTPENNAQFYNSDFYREIYMVEEPANWAKKLYERAEKYIPAEFNPEQYHPFSFCDFLLSSKIEFNSVFEIGAGSGANLIPLQKMGKQTAGCDYSPQLIQQAQKRGIDLVEGSIETCSTHYDLGILIHVFEHLLDPLSFLKQLHHNLTYLLIEIPAIVTRIPSIQNAHAYYYSPSTLRRILTLGGFEWIQAVHFSENDYLIAICMSKKNVVPFSYDRKSEVKRIEQLVRSFRLKQLRNQLSKKLRALPFFK